MKKIFNFAKKKKSSTGTPDNASLLSVGYELKDKDLGKVHKAASVGDLAKLKQLATKQKNDINQLDKENRTALHIACAAGHVDVVQFLVESKAKLNLCDNQIRSALMKAVQGQHDSCASILLENHADPNLVDINGNTALHLAASIPSVSTTGLLLEHEANINAPNKEGLTPLSVAVREDHTEMAEFLLKEGAGVNAADENKRSPLMMAAGNGQYDMLQLLLRYDADITLKDDRGWSADDYATKHGHHACSHLIDNHATQKSDGGSLLQQEQGRKKRMSGASQRTEGGFPLGGPAIDKDEHGANEAGGDFEDDSQSESVSRVSKSGADDWLSDNDEESPVIQKKPKKYNLRQMFASKAGAFKLTISRNKEEKSAFSEQPSCSKAAMETQEESSEEEEEDDEDEDEDDEDAEEEDEEEESEEEEDESEESEKAATSSKNIQHLFQFDSPKTVDTADSNDTAKNTAQALMNEDQHENTDDTANIQSEKFDKWGSGKPNSDEGDGEDENADVKPTNNDLFQVGSDSQAENQNPENSSSRPTSPANVTVKASQNKASMKSKNIGLLKAVASSPQPVRLNVKEDCIVSAIRVESKFSDEEDSAAAKASIDEPKSQGSDWDSLCEDEEAMVRKRKSSWGSSIDSEPELHKDDQPNNPAEESSNAKMFSPTKKEVEAMSKSVATSESFQEEKLGKALVATPTSMKKPVSESDWDSLSENASSKDNVLSPHAQNTPEKSHNPEKSDASVYQVSNNQNKDINEDKEKAETALETAPLELNKNNSGSESSWSDHEENLSDTHKVHPTHIESSEDSDSHDQKLEYDFATAKVKISGDGDVEDAAKLLSCVPLEGTKDNDVTQQKSDEKDGQMSDEALPQTDIDDVDVDSLDGSFGHACAKEKTEPCGDKKEMSTDDDSDQNEDLKDEDEEEESQEEEEEPEGSEHSHDAASTIPETDGSKDKKRDFMSELGLEKEEPVQDSWDSESDLDDANFLTEKKESKIVSQEEMPTVEEEKEEIQSSDVAQDQDEHDAGDSLQKETEKSKWEPLLNKLEGNSDKKPDLMEELGLGDADDLADASDWDSASTTSKHTLPGERRLPSPGIEEFPESPEPPKKDEVITKTSPVTPQRSSRSPSTASASTPHPQPRVRKMTPRKSDSQEESDWDSDRQSDNHMMEAVYRQALDEPESPVPKAAQRTEPAEESGEEESGEEEPVARKTSATETAAEEQRLSTSRDQSGNPTEDVGSEKLEPGVGFREEPPTQTAPQEHKPVATKRMPKQVKKIENSEEVEMAEDFDDLTQSSDTATEDLDSPSAGYRHAALLVDKLDSTSLDSRNMVKLQNIFHEYEHTIQKLKSRHSYLSDKVNQLEMERVDTKNALEEIKDVKSTLERNQLELQTEVNNLKFQLKQEQENRRNATMMYNTTKDKLKRTEEQQQLEVQDKQKVELTLRNLELEMRTLLNNMKQLEEDHSETQRLLAQERSARALQENLLNGHLRKQQEIEAENKRNISKSNEALSQLTEASDREKDFLQQTSTLQEQISILKADLERSQASSSLKESHLLEENENLKEQLEDARREVKANSEALTQTVFNCNNQLTTLKSELTISTNRFDNEKQARETLEREVESTRTRLTGAVQEAERCMAANADTEKALLREKEESQRLKDRLTAEGASHREAVSSLTQKLSKAETQANSLENEVHRVTLQLTEKGLLLDVLQKEKEQLVAQVKELDKALQEQKDLATKTRARHEATQERLAQAQSEGMLLRQQLEEANNKGDVKDRAVTDAQERFSDMLTKLRSDSEERVQLVEERNKELASKAADLRDQVFKLEEEKNDREASLRQLQQELADSLKKLSMSEASLEVNTRYRNDLEEEKVRILKDLDRLREKLAHSEDQYVEAEKRFNSVKSNCDEKEKELAITAQRLQEALSASAASSATVKQLEDAVQKLEIENARLEAAAKQQSNKIEALQKGAQEAAMVRGHLEELVTNLQSSKMSLEDQLSREVQKQSMLSHTAQDSQALWEQEVKSRSKLGLRLSELEKEKGELASQMEIEKKKVKKIAEQKKSAEARLDQEINRNSELQKEMYRLRTLLKTAKKKLRDQDMGAEFNSPMNSLRGMDMSRLHQDPRKVDDLQAQLDREMLRRSQLEKDNNDLREELSSLKRSGQNKQSKEDELHELRRQMEASQREQSQAEERARHELQHKLEQVNLFLQTQAASQEALDQIKAANQASVQSQMEQRIRELESELSRARSTQQDSLSQRDSSRTELERYRSMHSEELRLRKSLAAKLERANTRLSEANSKLLSERSKSLIAGSFVNSSSLGGSLGSSPGTLGLDRSLGLSLLSPVSPGHSRGVEDYITKMRNELDRNISKELRSATAELDLASARLSPVGSATLDPVSRATQDYLTVLKKNYHI